MVDQDQHQEDIFQVVAEVIKLEQVVQVEVEMQGMQDQQTQEEVRVEELQQVVMLDQEL